MYVEIILIDMYVKIGCLFYVWVVFDIIDEKKNIVVWNLFIFGFFYVGLV